MRVGTYIRGGVLPSEYGTYKTVTARLYDLDFEVTALGKTFGGYPSWLSRGGAMGGDAPLRLRELVQERYQEPPVPEVARNYGHAPR